MDNNLRIEINDLRLRWYSIGAILSDGTRLKVLDKDLKKLIKNTRSAIKKIRFAYDY